MKTLSPFQKLAAGAGALGLAAILISIFPRPSAVALSCHLVKKEEVGGIIVETSECYPIKSPQKGRGATQVSEVTP